MQKSCIKVPQPYRGYGNQQRNLKQAKNLVFLNVGAILGLVKNINIKMIINNTNKDFSDKCLQLYYDSQLKTVLLDATEFISAEIMFSSKGIEYLKQTFPDSKTNNKIIEEIRINDQSPVYRLIGIDNDIQDKTIESSTIIEARDESSNISAKSFHIPVNNNVSILSYNWENGNLKVDYIDYLGKIFQVTYSVHTLELGHNGDGGILFQAISMGKNSSIVITDESEKTSKRNLGYALRINEVPYYSTLNTLVVMAAKEVITTEDMDKASKELFKITNCSVSENLLIEAVKKIERIKNSETSLR